MSTLQTNYEAESRRLAEQAAAAAEAARIAELAKKKSPERLRLEEVLEHLKSDEAFALEKGFTLKDNDTQLVLQSPDRLITVDVNCQKLQVSKLSVMTILPGEKAKKKAAPEPVPPLQFAMSVGEGDTQWVETAEEAVALTGRYLAQVTFRSEFDAVDQ